MNRTEPSRNFEAARRQHLIDATIESLADVGFKATSLSQIARRADVSTGLFAHYFGDKDGLLEATLRFMAARLVRAARQRLRAAKTPRERLDAVPESALADQEFERRTSAVWLAFWGQITHSTRYQRIQFIYQRRMLSNLRYDLRALVPAHCVDPYATMIASMIDGVWIRSHASPPQTDGAQARAVVRALIDGLICGAAGSVPPVAACAPGTLPIRLREPERRDRDIRLVSPVTGQALHAFTAARREEIADAVEQARHGLTAWRRMTGTARAATLRRCADAIRADADELARLDAVCTGRAISQTLAFSLPRAARAFERFAHFASRPESERLDFDSGVRAYTRHEPVGLVAGFGHWSAPLLDACRHAAPALAFGNAMIFQPSAQAPLTALRLRDVFARAGLPAGLFAVLPGDMDTTRLIFERQDVVPVSARDSALESVAPKSATIVFADADLDQTARALLHGCRTWTSAPDYSENRVFVQERCWPAFRARLLAHATHIRWGDPLAPTTQIGGLISQAHLRHVLALVDHAVASGATLLTGGREGCELTKGNLLAPMILDGCKADMPIVRQSPFAAIVTVLVFGDDDDIVRLIARLGQRAPVGLFCADVRHAHEVANRLDTDVCCINDGLVSAQDDGGDVSESWLDLAEKSKVFSRSKRIFRRDDTHPDL